jgi:CRISPR-associated endonuclease Cas2
MALTEMVVAYDVAADDDRARLAAFLSHSGVRLQRSVFQCLVDSDRVDDFVESLRSFVDEGSDVVHVFRQCSACSDLRHEIGQAPPELGVMYWII